MFTLRAYMRDAVLVSAVFDGVRLLWNVDRACVLAEAAPGRCHILSIFPCAAWFGTCETLATSVLFRKILTTRVKAQFTGNLL